MKTFAPAMRGMIDRRILVNFRIHPDVAGNVLPSYFRPKLVRGWAIGGICLIRLKEIRPFGFPAVVGLTSENAAHRIAIEWGDDGVAREGVFIPRRDTSSTLQSFAGGRIFPGVQRIARFDVIEEGGVFQLQMRSNDGAASVELHAYRATQFPMTSVFKSLEEASEFFARGSTGYSATESPGCCDGLQLKTLRWQVAPLGIRFVRSSFFDDKERFPRGAIHLDCALLMQNIEHEWRVLPRIEGRVYE